MANVIWIDQNIYNKENIGYTKKLQTIDSIKLKLFQKIDEAVNYLKSIHFKETKIIVSGKLYFDFVNSFKENINDMCIIPKIIIFTRNEKKFINLNNDNNHIENIFYNIFGITDKFKKVKNFLNIKNKNIAEYPHLTFLSNFKVNPRSKSPNSFINKIESKFFKKSNDVELTFEYIDNNRKLILPLLFHFLIERVPKDSIETYNNLIYQKYSKNNQKIKELFDQIISIPNIPIELLSKYYARLYTVYSDFYNDLNKNLRLNNKEDFLPFIKILYEGVKLKSLPLSSDKFLYRVSNLSTDEINKIQNYLKNKKEEVAGLIVFSKSFLSFSKERKEAEKFLKNIKEEEKLSSILFILEKDDNNTEDNFSTHADIEKLSFYPKEREVLFFPFSSFEIKDIKEINLGKRKVYEIKLLYLGKYLEYIENNKNLIMNEINLQDSLFKSQLFESGLVNTENITTKLLKLLFNQPKLKRHNNYFIKNKESLLHIKENKRYFQENEMITYELEKKEIKNNFIIGKIYIGENEVNKEIQIINSFENYKRLNNCKIKEEKYLRYENEKEIIENVEIKINGKIIDFSYYYRFQNEGKYRIEYIFKNNLTKTNHLFYNCSNFIKFDLSNFNSEKTTNMSYMFSFCNSLKKIIFSNFKVLDSFYNNQNFNTQNVNDMSYMFYHCINLKKLDFLFFDTHNVTDMSYMFAFCKSLFRLNLISFDTQNVTNMRHMFNNCKKLFTLNLSSFNTKNVTDMSNMFSFCESLLNLDISNFNLENVLYRKFMFFGCNFIDSSYINDSKFYENESFYEEDSSIDFYSSISKNKKEKQEYKFFGFEGSVSLLSLEKEKNNNNNYENDPARRVFYPD